MFRNSKKFFLISSLFMLSSSAYASDISLTRDSLMGLNASLPSAYQADFSNLSKPSWPEVIDSFKNIASDIPSIIADYNNIAPMVTNWDPSYNTQFTTIATDAINRSINVTNNAKVVMEFVNSYLNLQSTEEPLGGGLNSFDFLLFTKGVQELAISLPPFYNDFSKIVPLVSGWPNVDAQTLASALADSVGNGTKVKNGIFYILNSFGVNDLNDLSENFDYFDGLSSMMTESEQQTLLNTINNESEFDKLSAVEKQMAYSIWRGSGNGRSEVDNYTTNIANGYSVHDATQQSLDSMQNIFNDKMILAAASGEAEESSKLVPWVKVNGGTSKMKGRVIDNENYSGYTGNSGNFAVGLDYIPLDNFLVGLSYSRSILKMKYNLNINSRNDYAKSHIISLYGSYGFNNKISIAPEFSMMFTDFSSKFNNAENNIPLRSSFKPKFFSANLGLYYKLDVGDYDLIPTIALNYIYSSIPERKTVVSTSKANKINSFYGKLGANFLMKNLVNNDNFIITPFVHAYVKQRLSSNKVTVETKKLLDIEYEKNNVTIGHRTSYNVGCGFSTLVKENFEFGLKYDFIGKNKYSEHQATINCKYSF